MPLRGTRSRFDMLPCGLCGASPAVSLQETRSSPGVIAACSCDGPCTPRRRRCRRHLPFSALSRTPAQLRHHHCCMHACLNAHLVEFTGLNLVPDSTCTGYIRPVCRRLYAEPAATMCVTHIVLRSPTHITAEELTTQLEALPLHHQERTGGGRVGGRGRTRPPTRVKGPKVNALGLPGSQELRHGLTCPHGH
jgi:hypothetical protein